MPSDRFFIAPYNQNSGLQNDVKPWLLPDQAFSEMSNAYVFRDRVRKRFGSRWIGETAELSRLRVKLGALTAGSLSGTVPTAEGQAGQKFSIGTNIFTAVTTGNLLVSGTATTATFDFVTGNFAFTGVSPSTADVYWYPGFPVMGLEAFEQETINDEFTIAFDTHFAYQYSGGWERLNTETVAGAATWTGDNSQFFWTTTWTGANAADKVFFVTNFNEQEPNFMRTYFAGSWNNFVPQVDGTNYLISASILLPFKNRLLAFNTWENTGPTVGGINYQNRVRASQIGSPLDANAWRVDIAGRGIAIDCPTTQAIITAEFVNDRLIVGFERSTWELVYTGNAALPFAWQLINPELGAESRFSVIPIDRFSLQVGNVGIVSCNGSTVQRIDQKIPNQVFDIHNTDSGVERVYGIRDYYLEMVYWTFPDTDTTADTPYCSKVLVYNYINGTWSINDDTITVFGYFQPTSGVTWDSITVTWDDDIGWDSGSVQAKFRQVIAGNQQGYTFICDGDVTTNAAVLDITDLTVTNNIVTITSISHNIREDDFVYLQAITGTGNLNILNDKIFKVINSQANPITTDTFSFIYQDDDSTVIAGTYSGAGLIARVSNISIKTKEYNFYALQGRNALINKIDFLVNTTPSGQIDVDFFVSTNTFGLRQQAINNNAILGTATLDTFPYTADNVPTPIPFEEFSTRVWHAVYITGDGEVIQLQLNMNDEQMMNTDIRECDFQLHAMCIYAQPTSYRLQ